MDPRLFLYTEAKPYAEAGGLIITEDGAWPFGTGTLTPPPDPPLAGAGNRIGGTGAVRKPPRPTG